MPEPVEIPVPPWRRPRRAARQRRPITQDLIVEKAMRVLDAEGLDALSMRRVAQELETGPASLYAHVANKEELLELIVDRIVGEVEVPAPAPDRWQEQIIELTRSMHRTWTRHRGIARAALANIPVGPNSLRLAEGLLAILRAGGVPDQAAGWFVDRISLYVVADAFEASLYDQRGWRTEQDARDYFDQFRAYIASLPAERFPTLTSMAGPLTSGGGDERFEFGVRLMVEGLAHVREARG